jgi:antitoxin component YwqK of YwqJK toxin-antitoxin module
MINIKRLFFVLTFFTCFFTSLTINAQKINQFDANNKRNGVWKKYYPNKNLRYSGEFKNGKEIGVFNFYDITSSKHPVIIKKYLKNSDSLFVQFYSKKGILETEGFLKGRKRIGKWKYFYANGDVMSEESYKNGLLDGEQLIYYPDGKVTEFAVYNNGLKHGVISKYSSKGVLIEEVTYKDGKPNGFAKYFELNGSLKESGNYSNGNRVGNWEYYMDGELSTDKNLKKRKSSYTKKKGD